MSDYKLVPVKPTPEMVEAARQHHEGESYLPVSLYKTMLAAAPAVRGEPVGYISHTSEGDILGWERQFDAPSHTPLYATPQPAEQQPDVQGYVMVPAKEFESVLNRADWRTAKNRAELRHMLKALQSSAAPDVSALVEALETLLSVRVIEADASYGLACAKAEAALAPHRKQGGEA